MVMTLQLFLTYDETFQAGGIPDWVFYWSAFAHFAYQTLDAIDGKQARRTESSSPLGQLFDHGCDAMSAIIIFMVTAWIFKFDNFHVMLLVVGGQIVETFINWNEYHTGSIHTQVGNMGVTEIQDMMTIGSLMCGYFGQEIF